MPAVVRFLPQHPRMFTHHKSALLHPLFTADLLVHYQCPKNEKQAWVANGGVVVTHVAPKSLTNSLEAKKAISFTNSNQMTRRPNLLLVERGTQRREICQCHSLIFAMMCQLKAYHCRSSQRRPNCRRFEKNREPTYEELLYPPNICFATRVNSSPSRKHKCGYRLLAFAPSTCPDIQTLEYGTNKAL